MPVQTVEGGYADQQVVEPQVLEDDSRGAISHRAAGRDRRRRIAAKAVRSGLVEAKCRHQNRYQRQCGNVHFSHGSVETPLSTLLNPDQVSPNTGRADFRCPGF